MANINLRTLGDEWGVDTSWKLTAQSAAHLAQAPLPSGQPIRFIWRYVSLVSPHPYDITTVERDAILNAGHTLLLVQHCPSQDHLASEAAGILRGAVAVEHARMVEYPEGCHIAFDLEAVSNSGAPVAAMVTAWCDVVTKAGYQTCLYVGYSGGLSAKELWDLRNVHRYWKAPGPWTVDHRGFCCVQGLQTTVAGVGVDPDHHRADSLGGCLVGMTA